MGTLLKITGVGRLISFYQYIYFNGPGVTKFSGVGLIVVIGLIHMYALLEHFEAAPYIGLSCRTPQTGIKLRGAEFLRYERPECAQGARRGKRPGRRRVGA